MSLDMILFNLGDNRDCIDNYGIWKWIWMKIYRDYLLVRSLSTSDSHGQEPACRTADKLLARGEVLSGHKREEQQLWQGADPAVMLYCWATRPSMAHLAYISSLLTFCTGGFFYLKRLAMFTAAVRPKPPLSLKSES